MEKPNIDEISVGSIDQIAPNVEHVSNNIAEQETSSAGGQEQKKGTRSTTTGWLVPLGILQKILEIRRREGWVLKNSWPNMKIEKFLINRRIGQIEMTWWSHCQNIKSNQIFLSD